MAFVPNVRNVRLYQNTGFDIINAPATPSLLDSFTYVDIPAINALQITRLNSVCIKATEEQVTNADYCRISDGTHNAYYAVTDYYMEKPDTCTLAITMDYMLTAGGVSSNDWDVVDGITERHHVATADDTLFNYVEEDPYLIPSKPLEIVFESVYNNEASDANNSLVLVEATVPLDEIGNTSATPEATAYTVTSSGEDCIVPKLPKLVNHSSAGMKDSPLGTVKTTQSPATGYFNASLTNIQEGLARVRELGIENGSIISQVVIPKAYIETPTYHGATGEIDTITGKALINGTVQSAKYDFVYDTAQNKRVYAGICNKYGILSIGSGNSAEFNPEDIYGSGDTQPSVACISDPRPSGRPYFRYVKYKNKTDNFFLNCIAGLNWQNVPLLYTDKSGSEIDTVRFQTEQSIKNQNAEVSAAETNTHIGGWMRNLAGHIGALTESLSINSYTPGPLGVPVPHFGGQVDETQYNAWSPEKDIQRKRQNAAAQELQEFNINQNIIAPSLMFPRSEGLRDFLGNGCYVYRYYLASSDVTKLDKILNMYGYRITEPLTKAMFNVRSKFSYVKAGGVSIGGTLPRWLREGMAAELSVGKRFWKVAPNKSYYATNGGNV